MLYLCNKYRALLLYAVQEINTIISYKYHFKSYKNIILSHIIFSRIYTHIWHSTIILTGCHSAVLHRAFSLHAAN